MVEFDEFGPEKIFEVYNPKAEMHGIVVLDNLSLGPGKGGIRMTPTVNVDEVARLARTMTWKNSLADLPFGGAKSGIIADDKQISIKKKQEIIKAFAEAIKQICPSLYVAAPDINTAEKEMEIFSKTIGSKRACTGKPASMGGIPHELGSTGFGVYHATLTAIKHQSKNIKDMTIALEGFGNVGWFTAKFLTQDGAKLIAVSDSRGTLYNKSGINFKKLAEVKKTENTVTLYPEGKILPNRNILSIDADILITAAVPDLITVGDIDNIKAKIIVEGSNIPTTLEVEQLLHKKNILVVPDFVANAGGVISSYVEYIGKNKEYMFKLVEQKIKKNTELVLTKAKEKNICPREAAMEIAVARVRKKCKVCKV